MADRDLNKKYPLHSELFVGELFSRLPEPIFWHKVKGDYPLYGRPIEAIIRHSEHKVELELGFISDDSTPSSRVVLYGEIDQYLALFI